MAEPRTLATTQAALDAILGDAPPCPGEWSDEQYLRLTDRCGRLIEFTDGYIQELAMPTSTHQAILAFLYRLFHGYLEPLNGIVLFSPLRMRIRQGKFREPDLLLLRDRSDARCQERYWLGADLVVEVVSPDDPERDLLVKRTDYAEVGIPEYWILDPRNETITVLKLRGRDATTSPDELPMEAAYIEHGIFSRGQTATSALLDRFAVDVTTAFDAPKR